MQATTLLEADHTRLCDLIRRLDAPLPAAARQRLLDQLALELDVHTRIEEEVFHPAVAQVSGAVAAARRGQEQVSNLMADLQERDPRSADFAPLVTALQDAVHHHVCQEEGTLFQDAERLGEVQLERLASVIAERQQTLRTAARMPARRAHRRATHRAA